MNVNLAASLKPVTRFVCGLLGLASVALTSGCEALDQLKSDRPSAKVSGVSFKDFGLDASTLVFALDVRNSYTVDLPLVDLSYGLTTGDAASAPFAEGSVALSGSVPALGTRTIELPVRVQYAELLQLVQGLRPGTTLPWLAKLEFAVDAPLVGRLALPLSHAGKLPIPAPPKVSLNTASWENVSLTEVSGVLDLGFSNPNDFAVDLSRFLFDVELAGTRIASTSVDTSTSFAAGGSSSLRVPISFSPLKLGSSVLKIIQGQDAGYRLLGDLAVNTPFGPLAVPIDAVGRTTFR